MSTGSERQSRELTLEPITPSLQVIGSERQSRELTSAAITPALQAIGSGPSEPGEDAAVNGV
jgi:hypothetical protein